MWLFFIWSLPHSESMLSFQRVYLTIPRHNSWGVTHSKNVEAVLRNSFSSTFSHTFSEVWKAIQGSLGVLSLTKTDKVLVFLQIEE